MTDPTRARILITLLDRPGYPAELAAELGLTRTNVSNHLACLRGCGIIAAEAQGRRTAYTISDPHLSVALRKIVKVILAVDEGAPCVDPSCACCGESK